MKIYQITEFGGDWEDSYEYVEKTYLSKEKAEEELSRLNDELSKAKEMQHLCSKCKINYGGTNDKKKSLKIVGETLCECSHADLKIENEGNESNPCYYIYCENNSEWCNDISGYRMREYEVTV